MTQNQLQYWRNVETERANRAQERTISSQINENLASAENLRSAARTQESQYLLNLANELLTRSKVPLTEEQIRQQQLQNLLSQFELGRQSYIDRQVQLDTELQEAEQLGKLFDARVAALRDSGKNAEFQSGAAMVGDFLARLFGGIGLSFGG